MEKLVVLATFLLIASAVPIMARMPQKIDDNNNNANIAKVIVEEIILKNVKGVGSQALRACANPGESCWNGVACCEGSICSNGPYNSVCVEISPDPWGPWRRN